MTIEILPARLANQIAAGEVVERPASVIKELVENSLDAGATQIHIEIEKGGTKKLRISDNGVGIVKDELTLALSRHATSKIKNLNDLESISSLGFRGEALASISSVSRLTITSKPAEQDTAWQACATGRDMDVTVQPAAHPNGTTIEVKDLFFNTPARRKFLRTEKTEFSHIDEVVRRIALARFDVTFTLTHNGKIMRQYRQAKDKSQYTKRVAQICGKNFIEHAIEVECQHGNLHLSGWLAKPSFARSQNDLCYSYVNGRMMRDKLINHAIRQAYAERLPSDCYPAFVLFLTLDYSEVDVNVHPAKHEVRFHQGRYVHDFIFSVCNDALSSVAGELPTPDEATVTSGGYSALAADFQAQHKNDQAHQTQYQQREEYVQPLIQVNESLNTTHTPTSLAPRQYQPSQAKVSASASQAYQQLMTPLQQGTETSALALPTLALSALTPQAESLEQTPSSILHFVAPGYGVIVIDNTLRLLSFFKLAKNVHAKSIEQRWQTGFVSQPLLLPLSLSLTTAQLEFVEQHLITFEHFGLVLLLKGKQKIQIRQFPALLREKDVNTSFTLLLNELLSLSQGNKVENSHWYQAIAAIMVEESYSLLTAQNVLLQAKNSFVDELDAQLLLNSVALDLTSQISQLV